MVVVTSDKLLQICIYNSGIAVRHSIGAPNHTKGQFQHNVSLQSAWSSVFLLPVFRTALLLLIENETQLLINTNNPLTSAYVKRKYTDSIDNVCTIILGSFSSIAILFCPVW